MKKINVMKIIKLKTLEKAKKLKWTSPELVKALMDLFELQHCDGFRCFSDTAQVDRAGIKHELLAEHNYVLFYLPAKHLLGGIKPIIPVVTYNTELNNVWYLDNIITTFATYSVPLGLFGNMPSYFIQEVLALQDRDTLNALKLMVGHLFEFWDLSLEVPTHCEALTPFFTQVQLHELVGSDPWQGPGQCKGSVQPMLCLNDSSGASPDSNNFWYKTNHLRPGLVTTQYITEHAEGATQGLQLKRVSRSRNYIIPIISQEQATKKKTLFASTTHRFLKAVDHTVVLGKGELLDCHKRLLLSLAMTKDFMSPPEMHNENYTQALVRFSDRVNSESIIRLNMPNHIDRKIQNPKRNELVSLGIKLLHQNIPDPFAIAELLCGTTIKSESYLKWCTSLANDESVAAFAKGINVQKLKERMGENWMGLQQMAKQYCRAIMGLEEDTNESLFQQWAMLFSHEFQTPGNAIRAQSMWQNMANSSQWKEKKHIAALYAKKHDVAFEGQRSKPDVKKARMFAGNAKVLMRMIKDDQIVIQKCLKNMGLTVQHQDVPQGVESKFTHNGEQQQLKDFLLPRAYRAKIGSLTWIKNLFHLLREPWWIYAHPTKREAVCTLLDVRNTILAEKNVPIFRQWICDHHFELDNYFESIKQRKKDILSTALEDSLCVIRSNWFNKSPENTPLQSKVQQQDPCKVLVKRDRLNDIVTRLRLSIEEDIAPNGHKDKVRKDSKRVRKDPKREASRYSKRAKYSACDELNEKAHKDKVYKARKRYPSLKDRGPEEEFLHNCREDMATTGPSAKVHNTKAHKPENRTIVGGDGTMSSNHDKSFDELSESTEFSEDNGVNSSSDYETGHLWSKEGIVYDEQGDQELWQM